jgi:hypothetical protein
MTEDQKKIIDELIKNKRLPYSVELVEVKGDKYIFHNNFGSTLVYIKKGEEFVLQEEPE